MEEAELDILTKVHCPKSFVWTVQHKYPRTTYNVDYRDWSRNPIRDGYNTYMSPLPPVYPLPPLKRFLPLDPSMDEKTTNQLRLAMTNPRGRKTPPEAVHFGYRHYSLDPTTKMLRHYNDPIPHPLVTIYRESYVSPDQQNAILSRLNSQTCRSYKPEERAAIGIVPCTLSIPPEPVKDVHLTDDYWSTLKKGIHKFKR